MAWVRREVANNLQASPIPIFFDLIHQRVSPGIHNQWQALLEKRS
jgi:hypothetical protein